MSDMSLADQFELNIDRSRLKKKIAMYEMQAREIKKMRKPAKFKKSISAKAEELKKRFGLE